MKEGFHAAPCEVGKPVQCGETIRLEHLDTRKNLHSHLFRAPLSGNQEVSAFGDENGNGDTGDNWQVHMCVYMMEKLSFMQQLYHALQLGRSRLFTRF